MKKNFQNPYKERNLTFPVLIVITVISAALILLSFSIFITEPKQELCDFSITYNDKSYDIKAATKLLSLEVSKTNSAVEHVSNLLKIYFDQTNKLCKHYRDGVMTSDEYREDLQKIGERFQDENGNDIPYQVADYGKFNSRSLPPLPSYGFASGL